MKNNLPRPSEVNPPSYIGGTNKTTESTKKLIRDHIEGVDYDEVEDLCPLEAYEYLKAKLHEEIDELIESDYKDPYEYADILEVLMTLARYNKVKWVSVKVARRIKLIEKGGFSNKLYTW